MKTAAWMLAALVACLTARADADGVCYDPNHVSSMTAESARRDMETIKAKGFSHVRTYISKFGDANLADIVVSSGLRAALGIPYGSDNSDIPGQIGNAVTAANKPGSTVEYIFVGNENAASGLGETASLIRSIKSKVPGNVKVGTVQRTIDYVQPAPGMAEVVAASDVVGVNIHPFFHPNTKAEDGVDEAKKQWQAVLNSGLPGIGSKLILTETGWPSQGSTAGNTGTPQGAAAYFQEYKQWNLPDNQRFYFQMFDTPYKGDNFERNYGIVTADSQPKFAAGGNPAPAPTPAPTPVPTTPAPTTPAPTTPAPTTPIPTKAANSTSSLSGSAAGEADVTLRGSGSGDAETGSVDAETDSSLNADSPAENEAGVVDLTGNGAATEDATGATNAGGATRTVGDNNSSGSVEATTRSGAESSSIVGVLVVAAFGVAAVGAAFAFIYKARQKAAELESSERKSFDSFAITPGGGCAL